MKLFLIQFDDQSDYVEALSMREAIRIWHIHHRKTDPEWDVPEAPEPDSCALVHDEAVVRGDGEGETP